jgi:hypothetical protein
VGALVGLGAAGLLYLAHQLPALIVFLAVGIFAGAVKLLDSWVE